MTQMPFPPDPHAPSSQLDESSSPAGSASMNADSVSANGAEIGEAHDDNVEGNFIPAETMRRASEAVRGKEDENPTA